MHSHSLSVCVVCSYGRCSLDGGLFPVPYSVLAPKGNLL
ncbi:Uncharacterised protein [Oligella ureolytica]|nr:Uncharacterised protein [Oligella ureolytica]